MQNIRINFCKIIDVIKEIIRQETDAKGNYLRRRTKPRCRDIEVIALSLTAECLSIDSESLRFSKIDTEYRGEFSNLISRRRYNERRKLLFEKIEGTRKLMTARLIRQAAIFAIDSMPLEICKIAREKRNMMGKESVHHLPE